MLSSIVTSNRIHVNGILHIGANYCQEQEEYLKLVSPNNIYWVEANPTIVADVKSHHPDYNIYQALITDKNDDIIDFHISNNNSLSSSIFEFDKHTRNHPTITFIDTISLKTVTLDKFCASQLSTFVTPNILVTDIQGAELLALTGGIETLKHIDIILTEVNIDSTYKGCGLVSDLDRLLTENNFKKIYQRIWEGHTYGDAVYIKQSI